MFIFQLRSSVERELCGMEVLTFGKGHKIPWVFNFGQKIVNERYYELFFEINGSKRFELFSTFRLLFRIVR